MENSGGGILGLLFFGLYAVYFIASLAAWWKTFAKAGRPGWAGIIPIYNVIVLLQMVGRPVWWLVLLLIPVVNIVIGIMVLHDLSKAFGKGALITVLQIFPIPGLGMMMLGFGDAKYQGAPAA